MEKNLFCRGFKRNLRFIFYYEVGQEPEQEQEPGQGYASRAKVVDS